jgi:hypothetical protein
VEGRSDSEKEAAADGVAATAEAAKLASAAAGAAAGAAAAHGTARHATRDHAEAPTACVRAHQAQSLAEAQAEAPTAAAPVAPPESRSVGVRRWRSASFEEARWKEALWKEALEEADAQGQWGAVEVSERRARQRAARLLP